VNLLPEFAVISAETAQHSDAVNEWRTDRLRHDLRKAGLAYLETAGSYKGRAERSFLVWLGTDTLARLKLIGTRYGQESILHVDGNRYASLVGMDGTDTGLGVWHTVDEATAKSRDAYTEHKGAYYIVTSEVA